jgi:hypothetical protein
VGGERECDVLIKMHVKNASNNLLVVDEEEKGNIECCKQFSTFSAMDGDAPTIPKQ